jgi:hypothetical protein
MRKWCRNTPQAGESGSLIFPIHWGATCFGEKFTISRYPIERQQFANRATKPVPDFVTQKGKGYER